MAEDGSIKEHNPVEMANIFNFGHLAASKNLHAAADGIRTTAAVNDKWPLAAFLGCIRTLEGRPVLHNLRKTV